MENRGMVYLYREGRSANKKFKLEESEKCVLGFSHHKVEKAHHLFVSSLCVSSISSRNGLNKISIFVKQIEFIYIK